MKWVLIFMQMSVGNPGYCDPHPFPVVKHADELFETEKECEDSFKQSQFYNDSDPTQIVGFCLPIHPLLLSPDQLTNRIERPKCK